MEIQNLGMISSSVVFLLRQNLTTIDLKRQDVENLLTPQVSIAQTGDGRFVFTSIADQLEIIIGVNRVDIRDLSRQAPRSTQIASVAKGILLALKADAGAYGINYEFESEVPNGRSGVFLLKTFIREDLGDYVGGLKGASLTLFFDLGDRQVKTMVEPRRKDPEESKIFVNVNIHKVLADGEQVPEENKLSEEINIYFKRVQEVLSSVPA